MTIEEKAERCRGKYLQFDYTADEAMAFDIGYEAGTKENRIKWHKVSEQIPTEEKDYLVKLKDGTVDVMAVALDRNLEPYLLTPKFEFYKDVEKWCEIPKE